MIAFSLGDKAMQRMVLRSVSVDPVAMLRNNCAQAVMAAKHPVISRLIMFLVPRRGIPHQFCSLGCASCAIIL